MREYQPSQYNILAYYHPKCSFVLDLNKCIATKLNSKQCQKIMDSNPETFAGYKFISYQDTDFSWWSRINQYLTKTKITRSWFECLQGGLVIRYSN